MTRQTERDLAGRDIESVRLRVTGEADRVIVGQVEDGVVVCGGDRAETPVPGSVPASASIVGPRATSQGPQQKRHGHARGALPVAEDVRETLDVSIVSRVIQHVPSRGSEPAGD